MMLLLKMCFLSESLMVVSQSLLYQRNEGGLLLAWYFPSCWKIVVYGACANNLTLESTLTITPGGRVTNAVGTIFRKIFVGTRACNI